MLYYIGIVISLFPMIVPYHFTLWEAASSPRTQAFLLVGTLFLLPVILVHSGWSYWVFRGKASADHGYHSASRTGSLWRVPSIAPPILRKRAGHALEGAHEMRSARKSTRRCNVADG